MSYYTVDRIEGDFAVLEDDGGDVCLERLSGLPAKLKEGDKLEFSGGVFVIDEERTKEGKKRTEERFKKLFLD